MWHKFKIGENMWGNEIRTNDHSTPVTIKILLELSLSSGKTNYEMTPFFGDELRWANMLIAFTDHPIQRNLVSTVELAEYYDFKVLNVNKGNKAK